LNSGANKNYHNSSQRVTKPVPFCSS